MAESSAVAFGRYLRLLRERRGLSLADVCELSQRSSESFDKGALSRLERGQQTPSIFRLGPLCRIYDVSADVLLERMELDRQVERLGGPETSGQAYDVLNREGRASLTNANRKWDAYAYFRDAFTVASPDKKVRAWINLATAIRSLGMNALALHELREVVATGSLEPVERAFVRERMSNCCRCLGEMRQAEEYADAAITQARELGDLRALAFAYSTRGEAALDQEQWAVANECFLKSLAAYHESEGRPSRVDPTPSFEAQTFLRLAECALRLREMSRAKHLTLVAKKMSEQRDLPLGLAYSELILGWIDEAAGHADRALARWRKAITLASRIDYPRVAFTAEVAIFRQALEAGDASRARAAKRRIDRLAPYVPRYIPAYRLFQELAGARGPHLSHTDQGEIHEENPKVSAIGSAAASRTRGRSARPRVRRTAADRS